MRAENVRLHTYAERDQNGIARDRPPVMRFIRRRTRTTIGSKPIRSNLASITIRSSANERVCNPLQALDIISGRMVATTVSSKRVTLRRSMRLIESPYPYDLEQSCAGRNSAPSWRITGPAERDDRTSVLIGFSG